MSTIALSGASGRLGGPGGGQAVRPRRRPVRYVDESVEEAYAPRASSGAPDWLVTAWVSTYLAIAAGELAGVTDDAASLAGHPARTLEEALIPAGTGWDGPGPSP